jgi:hypothetical protein
MASSASDLIKFEKQTNGENSGTWGTKANVALSRIEEAIAGYTNIAVTASNYTLDDTQYTEHDNGNNTSESHVAMIKATGTLTGNRQVIVPLRTKHYMLWNGCDAAYTLSIGGATGGTITVPQGYIQHVFCDGTNVEAASLPCDAAGELNMNGQGIVDTNGNELISFTETASAINELTVVNSDAGNSIQLQATGGDSNIDFNVVPKGSGVLQSGGTEVDTVGKQTIWMPVAAMRPTVSNGCAAITDVETTSGRPDMQVLDFDTGGDEHAQFAVFFPKCWDEGTVTFRAVWTTTSTDTDGVSWALQGVAVGDGDTIDAAYGTAVVVDDVGQSTAEDLYLSPESTNITIAGTPAADQLCFFRVFRDVSDANDTQEEDARLIGIRILFTTDAGNDD